MRCLTLLFCLISFSTAQARPSPYPITPFDGDKYSARQAQMATDVANAAKAKQGAKARRAAPMRRNVSPRAKQRRWNVPIPAPRPIAEPGDATPLTLYGGMKREAIEVVPTRWLAGVVAPLAAKAREIVAACGSKVISGVRHTYVAGTGGRLSLHASGHAVDIKGHPSCIYSHLRGWPGGVSTDYGAVQHVHFSYARDGPEWGKRFVHYRGGHRHKYRHRRS